MLKAGFIPAQPGTMKTFLLVAAALAVLLAAGASQAAGRLDARRAAIVPIAALTATGDTAALVPALERGLESGLAVNDIKEILIQMYAYCGFPRSLTDLETFRRVVEDRAKNGIRDAQGEAPAKLPANAERNRIGAATQTALLGRPAGAPVYDFAPGIDQFLKEHLFCDIFSRGVLTSQERELATVAALAALPAESQLRAHLGFSLNTGLAPEQLEDVVVILRERVGEKPAALAEKGLEAVLAARAARK